MCVLPAVCNLDRYRAASTCRVLRLSSAGGGTRLRDSAGISPDFPWIHVATLGAGAPGPSKPVPGCSQAVRMGWLNGQPLRGACRVGPAWRCRTSKSAAASLAAAIGVGHGRWSRAQALELHGPRISNAGTDLQRTYPTLTPVGRRGAHPTQRRRWSRTARRSPTYVPTLTNPGSGSATDQPASIRSTRFPAPTVWVDSVV